MVNTVHVVFKTHLDVGFTGFASDVIDAYLNDYIPRAIDLAETLDREPGDAGFIWTTGSWLVKHALTAGTPEQVARLDAAIRAGHVVWHGLPVTTQTEAMDPLLVEYGLSIAAALDRQYGRHTIAAKMTDVPGHTVGLVPFLAGAGIRYLHLGTNPASAVPEVPAAFWWTAPDGSSVLVNYDAAYGATEPGVASVVPGCDSALYLAHTNDNSGPPTPEQVSELFALLKRNYPGATIRASTLDDFARDLLSSPVDLPNVCEEIGDTWIHGIASDPLLTAQYRALLRLRSDWVACGQLVPGSPEYERFSDPLLLVPEHTWGLDLKSFLPDFVSYSKTDFQSARAEDRIDSGRFPAGHEDLAQFTEHSRSNGYSFSALERSWEEQRTRITAAVESLAPDRQRQALDAIARCAEPLPEFPGTPQAVGEALHRGLFDVGFGADGSITRLIDAAGHEWVDRDHAIGAYRYQTFGPEAYQGWLRDYCRDMSVNGFWAMPDFGKPGMELVEPRPESAWYSPHVEELLIHSDGDWDLATLQLRMPPETVTCYGAPRKVAITYAFHTSSPRLRMTLTLDGKDANRLPEASWLTINPLVGTPGRWRIDKLGTPVDPTTVVRNGNRNLHATTGTLSYRDSASSADITTLDAPVVAVGRPRLLSFDNRVPDLAGGFHVNLHNNVWGTNYRMWFEEPVTYRFELSLQSNASISGA
jgi:hypothetical protein